MSVGKVNYVRYLKSELTSVRVYTASAMPMMMMMMMMMSDGRRLMTPLQRGVSDAYSPVVRGGRIYLFCP